MQNRRSTVMRVVAWMVGSVMAVLTGVLLYSFISEYPQRAHVDLNLAHPYDTSCQALRVGSDLREAARTLASLPEPVEQQMEGNRLVIRWPSGECSLDFDSASKRVSRIESRAFTGVQFRPELR